MANRRLVLVFPLVLMIRALFVARVVVLAVGFPIFVVIVIYGRVDRFDDSIGVFWAVDVVDEMIDDIVDAIGIIVETTCLLNGA